MSAVLLLVLPGEVRMSDFDRGFIAGLISGAAGVWLVWLVAVW